MDLIAHISQRLSPFFPAREAEAMARIVSEDIFGVTLKDSLMGRAALSDSQKGGLDEVIRKLIAHVPVQYVTGFTTFCGHRFDVSPSVLIPRPETEDLVSLVMEDVGGNHNNMAVCDAGTGSGCIAVSLKLGMPNARVTALDISEQALETARRNARKNHAEVSFLRADMLDMATLPHGPWDIMVSNPPYIMEKEKKDMEVRVKKYEPSSALFVPGSDSLLFYKALASWATNCLAEKGVLYCEMNALLAEETLRMFQDRGFSAVSVHEDRYGKPRFVRCAR